MSRRRALMGPQGGDAPIYELTNHSVAMGDVIDTGVVFLASDFSGTVLLDIDIETNHVDVQDDRAYKLLSVIQGTTNKLYLGKAAKASTTYNLSLYAAGSSGSIGIAVGIDRYKIVLTHNAASNDFYVYAKKGSGTVVNTTVTNTFSASSATLTLGRNESYSRLPKSTVYLCKVYNRVLSSAEIDAFFHIGGTR